MDIIHKRQHELICLMNIEADEPGDWDLVGATHIRVSLPSDIQFMQIMQQRGYQFVDRMLDVKINLRRLTMDFEKAIRLTPVATNHYKQEIKELAIKNFTRDRRFHVEVNYNDTVAKQILDSWVDEISEFYVCVHKEQLMGFLALKEAENKLSASIHLAAVDERYRASGAALSLYANAILTGRQRGYQSITGCISSYNTAVMNLYAHLGGTFSNPRDIYLLKKDNK